MDDSLFYIASIKTKEITTSENPKRTFASINKADYFPKTTLQPEETASGRIVFALKNLPGRWTLKNKVTTHAFNFDVKKFPIRLHELRTGSLKKIQNLIHFSLNDIPIFACNGRLHTMLHVAL